MQDQTLVWSHWSWLTEEEDSAACDEVDAFMQGGD